jgi:hypothetical protein
MRARVPRLKLTKMDEPLRIMTRLLDGEKVAVVSGEFVISREPR